MGKKTPLMVTEDKAQAYRQCHLFAQLRCPALPGVDLQLAGRDVPPGKLVHSVMSAIVRGKHPQQ